MPGVADISLAVTSCDRHDLLKVTLESFYAVCDLVPREVIIFEDSRRVIPEFLRTEQWRGRGLRWISGGGRQGQAFACNRLIQEVTGEFTFWCEDDWLWAKDSGEFLGQSLSILRRYQEIIQVSLRGNDGWHPLIPYGSLYIATPYWQDVWGGWAWNPGLRRADLRNIIIPLLRHAGGEDPSGESFVSQSLLNQGYRIADLNRPIITHLGEGRSRAVQSIAMIYKIAKKCRLNRLLRYIDRTLREP